MRFSAVKHLSLLVFFLALLGCGNPQEEAINQLGQMDIKFTEDSFVERARDGNIAAVKLFLQAGMKPNVTSAAGETPLLVAVQFGRQDVVTRQMLSQNFRFCLIGRNLLQMTDADLHDMLNYGVLRRKE